ncbi:DNA polymerase III subunit gamma/tau [Flavobacteriaceae bacterium]|nr:DNA polymerase III subunit gamma/tau [Flavobacteriaceae bacterium]MDB2631897.1 DNA polymerase III subunit gamma/tau [Flavobacteriaceae bacterium]
MEKFVVSALKYRPKTFKDVVGQSAITTTLENAIKENHLAQALLFTGPRGVGKTSCARILAKMINSNGNANENEDFAFNIFELDAASNNSVDDIRNLTDQVRIPPQVGTYKVYIIDEVHMLSSNAFNAFLKTLEEPPKHCIFILATTEKHKIIPTILSRCQIFDFKRITVNDAKNYLKIIAKEQGIEAEDDALHIIAQKADGAMRDALSIFDRVVSFSGKNLTIKAVSENLNVLDYDAFFQVTDHILNNEIPELLLQFNAILSRGFEGQHFIAGLASHFRDLFVAKSAQTIELLEVGDDTKENYKKQSEKTTTTFLKQAIFLANDCDLKYKTSRNQRLLVELCLMKLASINFDGEKKKNSGFIIPAAYFKNKNSPEIVVQKQPQQPQTEVYRSDESEKSNVVEEPKPEHPQKPIAAPVLTGVKRQSSGLSLKSIQKKKEHHIKQMDVQIKEEDLPSDAFSEDQMLEFWNAYVDKLEKNGKYNLAAILKIDTPKLTDNFVIQLEFPNSTNKIEVERQQFELLQFLRKSLNNFEIALDISVNEIMEKKYAYTAEDKYKKLKEKNPALETLKQTFNLDL